MQTESEQLFEESKKYIPGGVNSPVRAFCSVGRSPIFIKKRKVPVYSMRMEGNI